MHVQAENGGLVYLILEHLKGKSVHDIIVERGPISVSEACRSLKSGDVTLL